MSKYVFSVDQLLPASDNEHQKSKRVSDAQKEGREKEAGQDIAACKGRKEGAHILGSYELYIVTDERQTGIIGRWKGEGEGAGNNLVV